MHARPDDSFSWGAYDYEDDERRDRTSRRRKVAGFTALTLIVFGILPPGLSSEEVAVGLGLLLAVALIGLLLVRAAASLLEWSFNR